jgi:tRNA pseudouridine(55) synthase
MQDKVYVINKKCGQTPLECINELKKTHKNMVNLPVTYAGRLDPLACGVLLLLVGDECLKKDEYLKLDKEYELDILFGFATDTYDVMGKVKTSPEILFERFSEDNKIASFSCQFSGPRTREDEGPDRENWHENFALRIQNILSQFTGRIKQTYPPYSSRPVQGKPLFTWAREGRLNEIEIPTHDVFVEKIEIIKEDFISGGDLLNKIKNDISQVGGDFRQKEIIELWEKNLENRKEEKFKTIKIKVNCGSGVYVRALANDIGKELNIPALALNIKRTKVGEYKNAE